MNKCKICHCNTSVIIDAKTGKLYHKCLSCEYISLDEKSYIDAGDEKKHYDKHHNNLESLGYVNMFEALVDEFVTPHAKNIKRALDFGCGEGEVLPIVLERTGVTCDRYDYFYFPDKVYKNKVYDMVVSTEVFEHLTKPLDELKELLTHIKKDGYLLLMTAFHPANDEEFFKWWYIRDITHIGFFTIKTFEYLAKKYNLKIINNNEKNIILFQKII